MRIELINVYSATLPVKGGTYRMASDSVRSLESTLVEVVTDDRRSGWGETCPIGPVYQPHHMLGARAAIAEIAPGMIGETVESIRHLAKRMDERLNGHGYAKAALDIAFLDLLGNGLGCRFRPCSAGP
jgi:L-alanine-DL-glutamate epimerase-like enolase superfamily enzyme